jgi:hypothetical protein
MKILTLPEIELNPSVFQSTASRYTYCPIRAPCTWKLDLWFHTREDFQKLICKYNFPLYCSENISRYYFLHFLKFLERFQSKTLRMIMDAPWYVPNSVIRRDLQIPTVKQETQRYSSQYSARLSAQPKWPSSKLLVETTTTGSSRLSDKSVAKTPAKRSAYQILSVIVVFVILVFEV